MAPTTADRSATAPASSSSSSSSSASSSSAAASSSSAVVAASGSKRKRQDEQEAGASAVVNSHGTADVHRQGHAAPSAAVVTTHGNNNGDDDELGEPVARRGTQRARGPAALAVVSVAVASTSTMASTATAGAAGAASGGAMSALATTTTTTTTTTLVTGAAEDDGTSDKDSEDDTASAEQDETAGLKGEKSSDSNGNDAMTRRQLLRKAKKLRKVAERKALEQPEVVLLPQHELYVVKISDLRDLVLWVLADGVNVPFLLVKHKQHVEHVVFLMVSGLHRGLLETYADCVPNLTRGWTKPQLAMAPGDKGRMFSSTSSLMACPLPKSLKAERGAAAAAVAAVTPETAAAPGLHQTTRAIAVESLMIDLARQRENNYLLAVDRERLGEEVVDFVELHSSGIAGSGDPVSHALAPLFAIDCEMCRTENGLELTRISVVKEDMSVVYNTFVRPHAPIVDYNTKYSGITANMLANVTTTVEDVQRHLRQLIPPNAILVGHSLENDLRVLKLFHHRVIDTALIYDHTRGKPFKPALRWLAENYLKRIIQDSEHGHDSVEDAKAAMALVLLKLKHGPSFGERKVDSESLFTRLDRHSKTGAMVDTISSVGAHAKPPAIGLACSSDYEVIANTIKAAPQHHFVFARLTTLEQYQKTLESDANAKADPVRLRDLLQQIDAQVAKLREALPTRTLFAVFAGHGDMVEARRWMARQDRAKKAATAEAGGWSESDQHHLEAAVAKGRKGVCMFTVVS